MTYTIKVNTKFNADEIRQELREADDIPGNVHEHIMNLRDQGVRKALTRLGWTPPGEESVQNQLCARIDELEMEKEALAAQLDRAETERDGLNEQLGKSERRAEYESESFRIFCHAIQRLEEIVGIDTGGYNGPGPAIGEVERIVKERDALAAHVEWLDGLRRNVIEAIHDDRFEDLDISFYRDDQQPPKPAISLARRDLIKQAEALEEAADLYGHAWKDEFTDAAVDIMRKGRGYI